MSVQSRPPAEPVAPRAYTCRCGRPVFFRNSECLACGTRLGYDPLLCRVLPLAPAVDEPARAAGLQDNAKPGALLWRESGPAPAMANSSANFSVNYWRCANLNGAAACNWLVAVDDIHAGSPALCRCCRLTRTLPDLSVPEHSLWWGRIEVAKRRLVSSLMALGLPVQSLLGEDPVRGLAFDLLRAPPGGAPVVTGHINGIITIDVEEADDVWREQRRTVLGEPYRTLLGHLRHESGHYYCQRLVEGSDWQDSWREIFGDERQDYAAALQRHYREGAPAQWGLSFVSAYASSHPWEDWAETWAHYLHLRDTLDTARSFGLNEGRVELPYEPFDAQALAGFDDEKAREFLQILNGWMQLTGVLNELSRSMGRPDFYPFVLSAAAVRKLHFVHLVITAAGEEL